MEQGPDGSTKQGPGEIMEQGPGVCTVWGSDGSGDSQEEGAEGELVIKSCFKSLSSKRI